MNSLRKFFHLLLLLQTIFLVCMIRIFLWLLPFHFVISQINRMAMKPAKRNHIDHRRLRFIAGNVSKVSRYVPRATCLTQAIAAMVLLKQYSYPAALCIGVARNTAGEFEAHAWIESNGNIVIGGSKIDLYTRYSLMPQLKNY
jgi:Transglutaminase-like superfamily